MSTVAAYADNGVLERRRLADLIVHGIHAIAAEQLATGEIPAYQRKAERSLSYTRTLLISTFVDDALSSFDPRDRRFESGLLDLLAHRGGQAVFTAVRRIRRGIRGFIAWQEEPRGTWRFFGRGSGIEPDACTIARAAATKLGPACGRRALRESRIHLRSLQRFRCGDRYYTFLGKEGDGYAALDPDGRPLAGHDLLVNAQVVAYLSLLDATPQAIVDFLLEGIQSGQAMNGTANFPNPLTAHFILAHTWQRACLPRMDAVRAILLPALLARQHSDGGFDGPLGTAMALSAMLDLAHGGNEAEAARTALLRQVLPTGGWAAEDFVVDGYGSPAWTTALALTVLIRYPGFAIE